MTPGSSVFITRNALAAASNSTTATAMARILLLAVFNRTTLLASNLKGGSSKRPGSEDAVRLHKLDPNKVDAIYGELSCKKWHILTFQTLTTVTNNVLVAIGLSVCLVHPSCS